MVLCALDFVKRVDLGSCGLNKQNKRHAQGNRTLLEALSVFSVMTAVIVSWMCAYV